MAHDERHDRANGHSPSCDLPENRPLDSSRNGHGKHRGPSKARANGKAKHRPASRDADEPTLPAAGTLARTKGLIHAAVRVWELKRGLRD